MKKILLMLALFSAVVSANAQTATEDSKLFDNIYVGVDAGVSTPLTFSKIFPVNPTATVRIGKLFTPIWGAEVEGTAWFGSHAAYGYDERVNFTPTFTPEGEFSGKSYNAFRGLYVGINGTMNVTNLIWGYNGTPRFFELSTIVGTGWIHGFTPNLPDKYNNHFGAKTGLDAAFNFGNDKQYTINVRPAVLWNISEPGNGVGDLAFNSKGAQLQVSVGFTYHFKTSNGTHHFKTYNIGAMNDEINRLKAEVDKKPKQVVREVVKEVPVMTPIVPQYIVCFAKASAELTNDAKNTLDKVSGTVRIDAFASPEGTETFNKELSQRRADAVATYLRNRGVTVLNAVGKGVQGNASNRIAIVSIAQ